MGFSFDQLVRGRQRAPGIFHFVAHEKHFPHAFFESDIALLHAENRGIEAAAEQRRELIALSDIEIDRVFVAVDTVFAQHLLDHKGRDRGDARRRYFLSFEIFRAGDIGAGNDPLQHPVVGRDHDL